MSDLIKRDDAIKALKDSVVEMGGDDFCEMGVHIDDIEAVVNAIPSADRWIPCSERLPRDWEHVLVYTDITYTTPIFVDWYVDEVGSWANEGDSVIAWMPLPEPWKGADDVF